MVYYDNELETIPNSILVKNIRDLKKEFYLGDFTNIIKQSSKEGIKGSYNNYDFCFWKIRVPSFRDTRYREAAYQIFISIKSHGDKISNFIFKSKEMDNKDFMQKFSIFLLIFSVFALLFFSYGFNTLYYLSDAPISKIPNAIYFIYGMIAFVLLFVIKGFCELYLSQPQNTNNNNKTIKNLIPKYFSKVYEIYCSSQNKDEPFYKKLNEELYSSFIESKIYYLENQNNCFYFEIYVDENDAMKTIDYLDRCCEIVKQFTE